MKWWQGALWAVAVIVLAGCQGGSAARFGPPTLTPVLLPAATRTTPAVTTGAAAPVTVTPGATSASTTALPEAVPATGNAAPPASSPTPVRVMALGVRPGVVVRSAPSASAPVIADAPGASVFWIEGAAAEGEWVWATADGGASGWIAIRDLKPYGELAALPIVTKSPATQASSSTPAPRGTPAAPPTAAAANAARPPTAVARTQATIDGALVLQSAPGGDIFLLRDRELRRITSGMDPALSPDGTRLAVARWGHESGIYVIDLATGSERRLAAAEKPRSPSWRSDGSRLVFSRVTGTSSCRQSPFGCLTEDELRSRFGGQDCLTTQGGTICIADLPLVQTERSGLTQVAADGSGWLDLPAPPDAQSPSWRPGTDEVLFVGDGRLQMTSAGGAPRVLAAEAWTLSPAWSPDGARIAAQQRVHDRWEIVVLGPDGRKTAQVTNGETDSVAPAWSADGRAILFLRRMGEGWQIMSVDPAGRQLQPLRSGGLAGLTVRYDYANERVITTARQRPNQ